MLKPTKNKVLYKKASKKGTFTHFTNNYYINRNDLPMAASPEMMKANANSITSTDIPKDALSKNSYTRGNKNLRWAHNHDGVVYLFDRGVIMYSKNGEKKVTSIDPTDKDSHHADLMYRIAADFGDPIRHDYAPMLNALNANKKDMTVLMLEGSTVQIYLPEHPRLDVLEDIKKELEPRKNFTIEVAVNGSILLKNDDPSCDSIWNYDEITEYLDTCINELKEEQQKEEARLNAEKDAWLLNRLAYIKKHKSTPYNYFYNQWLVYKTFSKEVLELLKSVDPFLDDATIDLIKNSTDINMPAYYATIMTQAMNNVTSRQQEVQQEETEEEKLAKARKKYYKNLQAYTKEHNVSTEFYFYALGRAYKNNLKVALPDFEKQNPFLTKEDIDKLISSDDDRIVDHFAHSMNKVMDLYKQSLEENKQKQDTQETQETQETQLLLENKYEVSEVSIDSKVSDSLNGFVVRTEIGPNKTNVYSYEASNKEDLKGRKRLGTYNLRDGYYVNINEYMNKLTNSIIEEYPDAKKITIKTAEGEEIPYNEFCERAFVATASTSTIRMGRNYTENNISSYQEALDKYDESTAIFGGTRLHQGIYVRKSALDKFAKDYKFSITNQKQASPAIKQYSK